MTIRCLRGSVWITLDGESADIVLEAGQGYTTPKRRRTLLYGLTPARRGLAARADARRVDAPARLVLERLPD